MNALTNRIELSRNVRTVVLGAALAAMTSVIAAVPARADDDGWHHRHEWREHEWREHRRPYVYVAPSYPGYVYPGYVYAPPPVVYAPPPVVYQAPPPVVYAPPAVAGLNVVFPIHIR